MPIEQSKNRLLKHLHRGVVATAVKEAVESKIFYDRPPKLNRDIMQWLIATYQYEQVVSEATARFFFLQDAQDYYELSGSLAGELFATIAHGYFRSVLPPQYILLLRKQLMDFFAETNHLQPKFSRPQQIITDPFDQTGIAGFALPEALLVERKHGDLSIAAYCQYTAFNDVEKKVKDTLIGYDFFVRSAPVLFRNSAVIFVLPNDPLAPSTGLLPVPVPKRGFTHQEFADLLRNHDSQPLCFQAPIARQQLGIHTHSLLKQITCQASYTTSPLPGS